MHPLRVQVTSGSYCVALWANDVQETKHNNKWSLSLTKEPYILLAYLKFVCSKTQPLSQHSAGQRGLRHSLAGHPASVRAAPIPDPSHVYTGHLMTEPNSRLHVPPIFNWKCYYEKSDALLSFWTLWWHFPATTDKGVGRAFINHGLYFKTKQKQKQKPVRYFP